MLYRVGELAQRTVTLDEKCDKAVYRLMCFMLSVTICPTLLFPFTPTLMLSVPPPTLS